MKNILIVISIFVSAMFIIINSSDTLAADLSYTYDNLNRLTKVDYGNGLTELYTYDAAGNRISMVKSAAVKNAQTIGAISFTPSAVAVGGAITVSAIADSGLAVTFTSTTPSVCTVSGTTVNALAGGTCSIAADQTGNANYNAATQVTRNITVSITVPGAPTNPTAIPRNAQTTVSFIAPVSNGGSTITGYTITSSPGNFTATGMASPITVSGLTNGIAYTFTVMAANAAGHGPASTPSNSVTPVAPNTTAPTLILSSLANGAITNNATLNISGTVTDPNGVTSLTINMASVVIGTGGSFSSVVTLKPGANTIITTAVDTFGNQTTDTRIITLDLTVPVLTVTTPTDNSKTAAPLIPISGTADATATLTLTINGGSPLPLTLTGTEFSSVSDVPLTPGINTLIITTVIPGGKTASAKRTVSLDTLLPSLAVTDPNQDAATGQQLGFTIEGTAAGLTAVTVTITVPTTPPAVFTPPVTSGAFTQPVNFAVSKTYPITVTAADLNGNTATTVRNIIFNNLIDGDMNGDGTVTIADALLALRTAVNLHVATAQEMSRGNVAPLINGVPVPSGSITIADALLILKKVVGLVSW
jgi:YD repeat-containing protein